MVADEGQHHLMLTPPSLLSSVDVPGLQRLNGPLASTLGLFCSGRPSPSPPRPACFKDLPPTSSSGEKPGLCLPSSTLLFIAQAWPTGGFFCLTVSFFRGRKCLLFHEVEIKFLIKDRRSLHSPETRPGFKNRLRNDTNKRCILGILNAIFPIDKLISHSILPAHDRSGSAVTTRTGVCRTLTGMFSVSERMCA